MQFWPSGQKGNEMLVLSRKKNERILVNGGEIVVKVVDIRGDKVRLGIEAAKNVAIDREEVFVAKQLALATMPQAPTTDCPT